MLFRKSFPLHSTTLNFEKIVFFFRIAITTENLYNVNVEWITKICSLLPGRFFVSKYLEFVFSSFEYLEDDLHMLGRSLDCHQWFGFAIQTVQEMGRDRQSVVQSTRCVDR